MACGSVANTARNSEKDDNHSSHDKDKAGQHVFGYDCDCVLFIYGDLWLLEQGE